MFPLGFVTSSAFVERGRKDAVAVCLFLPKEKLGGRITGCLLENLQGFTQDRFGLVAPAGISQHIGKAWRSVASASASLP